MALNRALFLNSGYCSQLARLAGAPSWRWIRFYAVFVYLEHSQHGAALIDTGYSPQFIAATRRFPQRLYRWMTPLCLDKLGNAAAILQSQGIKPESIQRIFVSHFHGDHIAGLLHFPGATFVYRPDALEALMRLSPRQQVHEAFLADCLPPDFAERGERVRERDFQLGDNELKNLRTIDYFGDASVMLVDLPGHARGHTGYLLRTEAEQWLYVVDACWHMDVMLNERKLPRLSQSMQHDYTAYVDTQCKLRAFAGNSSTPLLACHCPKTQKYVANS